MMDTTHIADGIAFTLLLAGLVLTSGTVGVLGVAPVTSHATVDGPGTTAAPAVAFPIDNVTTAFPIDNVTFSSASWDVRDTDSVRWLETADGTAFRMQDMDPYAVPDGLPQDMDPY